MNIREAISVIPLLRDASPGSQTKLISYARTRKIPKGDYLFHSKEDVSQFYLLASGYAVLDRPNRYDGKRAIFILSAGSAINEVILENSVSSISCRALTDLEIVCLPRQRLLEIMENDFGFSIAFMESMARKIRRLYRQLGNTTKMMHLEQQVSARLWKLGKDFGIPEEDHILIPFDVTITLLADLVGSNRETVSRIVKKLSSLGLVSIIKGRCILYDLDAIGKYSS